MLPECFLLSLGTLTAAAATGDATSDATRKPLVWGVPCNVENYGNKWILSTLLPAKCTLVFLFNVIEK